MHMGASSSSSMTSWEPTCDTTTWLTADQRPSPISSWLNDNNHLLPSSLQQPKPQGNSCDPSKNINNFLADQLAGWLPYYHCSRDFIRFPLKKKWGFMYKLKALLFKLFFTTILLLVVSSSSFFKRLLSNTLEDPAITFDRHLPPHRQRKMTRNNPITTLGLMSEFKRSLIRDKGQYKRTSPTMTAVVAEVYK